MINLRVAYAEAQKLTESKYLRQIISFDKGYGFIFTTERNGTDMSNDCIFIGKESPMESAIIPVSFENLPFLQSGKQIPVTMVL